MTPFGAQLAEHRKRARLSQNELAKRVGVDAAYINKMEKRAACHPSREVVDQMVRVLALDNGQAARLMVSAGHWPWAELPPAMAELVLDLGVRICDALDPSSSEYAR